MQAAARLGLIRFCGVPIACHLNYLPWYPPDLQWLGVAQFFKRQLRPLALSPFYQTDESCSKAKLRSLGAHCCLICICHMSDAASEVGVEALHLESPLYSGEGHSNFSLCRGTHTGVTNL